MAKHLSGWSGQVDTTRIYLSSFEGVVLAKIHHLAEVIYSGCDGIDSQALDILMASILWYYPSMIEIQVHHNVGFIARVRECMEYCGVLESEFLAWHCYLTGRTGATPPSNEPGVATDRAKPKETSKPSTPGVAKEDDSRLSRLEGLLVQVLEQNRVLGDRVIHLETLLNGI